MNDKKNYTVSEGQLLNYFSGTLSVEERKFVEEWISESESNKKVARDIHFILTSTSVISDMESVNASKAFSVVKHKITKTKKTPFVFHLQKIAAILFIPLLLSSIYLFTKNQNRTTYAELRATPGMTAYFNLPDGSEVWLNSGAVLKYPTKFNNKLREVELEGEAYFSVKHNKSQFRVNISKGIHLDVLGTEFNVEAFPKKHITATLVKGSVSFTYLTINNVSSTLLIKPNNKLVYYPDSCLIKYHPTFTMGEIAWREGKIILRNTSLVETLDILSKRFNVDFILKDNSLKDNYFTGSFDSQHLVKILEHLRISSNIKYQIIEKNGKERSTVILYE